MSFEERIRSETEISLQLIKAYTPDQEPFHAYIAFRASELDKIKKIASKGPIDFSEHGVIIYSDFGHDISDDLDKRIVEDFYKIAEN